MKKSQNMQSLAKGTTKVNVYLLLIRLIGLGELLSVISHLLQSQFQFYG
jgi:hypothetical protein